MPTGSVANEDMARGTFASPVLAAASAGSAQVVTLGRVVLGDGVLSEKHRICIEQVLQRLSLR